MKDGFYRQTAEIEARHWWFVHRRRLVARLLDDRLRRDDDRRGIDLGCGSGGNLALLARYCGTVVGVDRSPLALDLARSRRPGARLVRADVNRLEPLFPPGHFGLATIFNVLYHRWVTDDGAVLAQVARLLAPGGYLVLTEPASPALFRRHDLLDDSARRYRRAELARLVREAGLELDALSYFNAVSWPAARVLAAYDRISGRLEAPIDADDERAGEMTLPARPVQALMAAVSAVERGWIARLGGPPFGVGLLALAHSPGSELRS